MMLVPFTDSAQFSGSSFAIATLPSKKAAWSAVYTPMAIAIPPARRGHGQLSEKPKRQRTLMSGTIKTKAGYREGYESYYPPVLIANPVSRP
jgi:hypothetical protein